MTSRVRLVATFVLTLIVSTTYATNISVTEKADIAAPPADVWAATKDFGRLPSWHPAFVGSTNSNGNHPGSVRVLDLGGPTITEELIRFNDEHRNFTYKINQVDPAVMPIENYVSWFAVRDNGNGGSSVIWMGTFNTIGDAKPEDVEKSIQGVYRTGLDHLKTLFEAPAEVVTE